MNWLDFAIVVFIIISVIVGLMTGLIKSIISLAGLIVGIILAGRYYILLADRLTFISSPTVARVVAFAIILVGVMVIAAIIARLLTKIASALLLGLLNRLGGALFGLVVGALLAGAVLAVWIRYLGTTDAITQSHVAPFLLKYFPLVLSILPEEFQQVITFF